MSNSPFTKRMGSHIVFEGFAIDLLNHWCIYSIFFLIPWNSSHPDYLPCGCCWKWQSNLNDLSSLSLFLLNFQDWRCENQKGMFSFSLDLRVAFCGDISELCIGLFDGMGAFNTKFDKRFGGIPAFLQEEGHYLGTEGRALQTVTQLHRVPECSHQQDSSAQRWAVDF